MITTLDIAKYFLGEKSSYTLEEVENLGLPFFAGCYVCGESLGVYNSYPDKNGYIHCRQCLHNGYETVDEYLSSMFEKWI